MKTLLMLPLILVGLSGCGYNLVGTTTVIPDRIKAIVVQPFENRTPRPEIEQRVTEEIARQLSQRRRYQVITDLDAADAVMVGAITDYRTFPVQFSETGRTNRVEVVVRLAATMRERATDEVLWSQANLIFRGQFDLEEEVPIEQFEVAEGQRLEFFDQETLTMDQIARGAAGVVISSIFEGF